MRHVIVHYHIFKNAGSTVDFIFNKHFGDRFGSIDGNTPDGTLDSNLILQYLLENPKLKMITSHQVRLPVPVSPAISFYPIVFLRHPIDRVGSVYLFERRQEIGKDAPVAIKIAHENGFEGYVRWRLAENHGAVIKNFQTIYLSGREKVMRTAVATTLDLEVAMKQLKNLAFFGVVELFQSSVFRMKDYLFKEFGDIDVSYSTQNKSDDRKSTLQERLDEIRDSLGMALYNELIDKNALDLELYNNAVTLFEAAKGP